jgi:hypothetical protein
MLEMQQFSSKFSLVSIASGKQASKRAFELFLRYLYLGENDLLAALQQEGISMQDALYLCECDEFY